MTPDRARAHGAAHLVASGVAACLAAVALTSCGGDHGASGPAPGPPPAVLEGDGRGAGGAAPAPDLTGTVTVFAAASLSDAFGEVAAAFEDRHDGLGVALSFAGSSSLREQVLAGAPADVLATADEATMAQVVAAGAAAAPVPFADNELQLVVPAGNPADVAGLSDLADPDLLVGLCAEQVPCGRLARRVLAAADVVPAVDTEEPDVRSLLTRVAAGELDAGLVYRTDVVAARGAVEGIELAGPKAVTTYPIAVLGAAGNPRAAGAFVDFVRSGAGQAILDRHGFGPR